MFALLALALCLACGDDTPDQPPAATATATPEGTFELTISGSDGKSALVRVELADTNEERARGLMDRDSLPEVRGMLFLFPANHRSPFWMKNTRIPLDIAYLDASGRVLEVKAGKPFDETLLQPSQSYRHTLEVNGGWFARHGLGVGSVVRLPEGLPTGRE